MKTIYLILVLIFAVVSTSCTSEYISKSSDGDIILITDQEGIVLDAIALQVSEISVYRFSGDNSFTVDRSPTYRKDTTVFYVDTLSNGNPVHGYIEYKTILLKDVIDR